MTGIIDGFRIISSDPEMKSSHFPNHSVCYQPQNKEKIDKLLRSEIAEGKYVVTSTPPVIISPLLVVPKDNGTIRLIQDCSYSTPGNTALNDLAHSDFKIKYQTVQNAINMLQPGYFMCKLDLRSAYRSVPIHPKDYKLTGIQWKFSGDFAPTYMYDTMLMQGAKLSPMIFHRLSQSIQRYVKKQGITMIAYLDDFLLISKTYQEAIQHQIYCIKLLRRLGFSLAWEKVVGPTEKLTFLGVELNSIEMTIALPQEKIECFKEMLHTFSQKKRASRKQLEKLCGKLSWAASVIKAGRCYLRRIFNLLLPLCKPYHKIQLTADFYADIQLWVSVMDHFPGKRIIHNHNVHTVFIDSCNTGCGAIHGLDWLYVNWDMDLPDLAKAHINVKETVTSIFAVRRWAKKFKNSKVVFFTDNTTARANISKGTSITPEIMPWLRELHYIATLYNFDIVSIHIPGEQMPADDVSRLDELGHLRSFMSASGYHSLSECALFLWRLPLYMTVKSALFIYEQVMLKDG